MAALPPDQGRARGLYDEQLQRQQQEKALDRSANRPILFASNGEDAPAKTGAPSGAPAST